MKQRRRELKALEEDKGQATFFSTASFADGYDPHLQAYIVNSARLSGTDRDPTVGPLHPKEKKRRAMANVATYTLLVAEYWEVKTKAVREFLYSEYGIYVAFDRHEYQSRRSAHLHSLYWHNNAPPDTFLDTIGEIVVRTTRSFHDEAVRAVNHLASCSPVLFRYEYVDCDRNVIDPGTFDGHFDYVPKFDESDLSMFKDAKDYPRGVAWSPYSKEGGHKAKEEQHKKDVCEIRVAVKQALDASKWYSRIDATSRYWSSSDGQVSLPEFAQHPSARDVTIDPELVPPAESATDDDDGGRECWEDYLNRASDDYDELRAHTGRHTSHNPNYC